MVLRFHGVLPEGALVRADRTRSPSPVWLSTAPSRSEFLRAPDDPSRITAWRSLYGDDCQALAVAANKTGTSIAENPARLTFRAEENSGLVLADVISDAGTLTFGLIFWPEAGADPRTLLSLQPRGEDDYLFLSGDGGVFRAAQKSEQMELALPPQAADAAARILICAISGSVLRLCLDFGPVAATPLDSPFQGRADLFIGCRNARAGLRRKLGAFGLTDVMAWPGEDLLSVPDSPALEAVKAVWRDRCAHAI